MASTSWEAPRKGIELTIDIPDDLETNFQDSLCIYSVPPTLRKINSDAYTPQVISIGPIHHGKAKLQPMHIQKLRYFKEFCKRKMLKDDRNRSEEQIRTEFAAALLKQIDVEEMRRCYSDDFEFCSTEFVNMILLDSVFILEFFLRHKKGLENQKDFIVGKPWLRIDVQQDLILLENQLPFSILNKLYEFSKSCFVHGEAYPSFLDLTCDYFSNLKPSNAKVPNPDTMLHFTDLVRQFWIHNHPDMGSASIGRLCSITKLHQAGVKLKPARNKCRLEICFQQGITCLWRAELQLPCFEVDDTTEILVRNLMALEQCHYPLETYVCNYMRLWDLLIDTAEDVDLLVEKKILVNGLGDGATVAHLVNKLCNQIAEVHSCYYQHSMDMSKYYEYCGNHTMAILRSIYFGDLWRGTGTAAAVLFLILTAIQAVCSILQLRSV